MRTTIAAINQRFASADIN